MHRVGFEPTTPVFEQEKKVHASDLATTVISTTMGTPEKISLRARDFFFRKVAYSVYDVGSGMFRTVYLTEKHRRSMSLSELSPIMNSITPFTKLRP
jgi:hypothetical protein